MQDGKPVSRLMAATILSITQDSFIEYLTSTLEKQIRDDVTQQLTMATLLPDIEKFKTYIKFYFQRLLPEFFSDWGPGAQGFDGSIAVRDKYKEAVKFVIGGERQIADLKSEPHFLYASR